MLLRKAYLEQIHLAFQVHPVTVLLGPRQCGKTTLAREYVKTYLVQSTHKEEEHVQFFDLEDPTDLQLLQSPRSQDARYSAIC